MKTKIQLPENFDLEERVAAARANFRSGYNCCQSVILAYNDIFGLDANLAATLTSGFGGGMGRLREVCGSVSGMFFLAGLISPAADPTIKSDRTENYALIQEFADKFRQQNGSIVCRELLGLTPKRESPEPSDRTPEYYKKRPCEEYIAMSARIAGEKILEYAKS